MSVPSNPKKIIGKRLPHLTQFPNDSNNVFPLDRYKDHPLLLGAKKKKRDGNSKKQKKKLEQNEGFTPSHASSKTIFRHSDSLCIPLGNEIPVQDSVSVDCLRVCIERAWIPKMDQSMLDNILKLVPLASKHPLSIENLLQEVKNYFENCLQRGTLQMTLSCPEESYPMDKKDKSESDKNGTNPSSHSPKDVTESTNIFFKDFIRNRQKILLNLHILHPCLRTTLDICKHFFNDLTLADFESFGGKSLDLDSFCGNIISESEKNEELIINDWYPQILKVFANIKKIRGERRTRFHNCASSLLSIQLRGLLMKNISKYVSIFRDRRKIPRIEMELVLSEKGISFQPSVNEVINMLVSVIYEMNKLLREVPTIDSWYSEGASQFVQVGLNDDFISKEVQSLKDAINNWMMEPEAHHRLLANRFEFLINGTSKAKIHDFIRKSPKFEEICEEYKSYKLFVDQTQEISSLEYFTLVRLDCENLRKSLGQAARKLSNLLLKNVVDTYREENQAICKAFEQIEKVALQSPQSTKEMIEFGEFMLNVKNKKMIDLTEEIEHSKRHLLYLIDVHVFDPHDIELNTLTLGWLVKIRPVFEQNTEIIEDCKARFEDNLQKKSEWALREIDKLSSRVHELEELGEISNIQQYTYEVRQIQNKLKKLDETIKWINLEEALFKFPQTTYSEVENMNINIDPYSRLFTTVLKWQKAEKKCTDGAFLDLNASQIENSINEFMDEMSKLQKLFKLKFKQQALDGDSKYAKMNLEDSDPMNLPPPLRISALTILQIKGFQKNIQLITCLCNPGLRKRHWIRMGSIIGFDITPNSGSSLRKMLCLNLEKYMPELEKISNMATREHGLELTLANMKTEWESKNLELITNDGYKILSNFESIQEVIDDHTSKTETVKGSPYFKPFKDEVESWENDLKTVHESLSSWRILQKNYVNFEPFFSNEEIISQMPLESTLFKKVEGNWKFVLEHINSTPQVMKALNKMTVINALNDSTSLLEQIQEGLDKFTHEKCLTFPRLFFLSRNEVLSLVRNTTNPIDGIGNILSIIFEGISCLLVEENQIIGFKGQQNELILIKRPIDIHASGGCVERILMELENQMILTLKQQILDSMKATDTLNLKSMAKYSYQANEVSLRLHWTEDVIDGIKGGINALKELKSKLYEDREILLKELKNGDSLRAKLTSSLILQNIYFVDSINDLITNEVLIEEDFVWEKKPKATLHSDDVFIDIFNQRHKYCYEYSGTFFEIVWTPEFEMALLTLFICYEDHKFTIIRGQVGSGKRELFTLACSILGKQHQIRNMPRDIDHLKMLLPGICYSGSWLLIKDLESVPYSTFRDLISITKKIEKVLYSQNSHQGDLNVFGHNLPLLKTSYIAFTSDINGSCVYIDVLRPITLIKPRVKEILEHKILAYNFEEMDRTDISEHVMSLKYFFSSIEKYELTINYKDIGLLLKIVSHLKTTRPDLLPFQCFQTAEYIIWKGRMDLSDSEPIIEKMFRDKSSLTKVFERIFNEKTFAECKNRLGLKEDESQLELVKQVLFSLKVSKKVILCGPPVSGKSSVLKVAEMYENERLKGNLEVIRLRPNGYNSHELFGQTQCNEWKDGTLTSSLKKKGKGNKWIVFEGPMRSSWISVLESITEKGDKYRMILESRDHLIFTNTVAFLFETTSISEVSPKFISTCTLLIATSRELNWILLLDQWIERKDATQSWKEGYEDSIRDIVIWLCPPVLKFIKQHAKPVIPFIPIHSVRCFLSCFSILLHEALPNLKEKKYLRMWIQAAIIVSIVWTMGSTLTTPERSKFDVYLRDILSGKKVDYPLPASLNNKFDAIPPSEGTIYDFIFDFKARGQWKHWNDITKNLSAEDSITYYENRPIVHSVDTLRFSYFYNINMKRNIPTLLVGHSGCGKTSIVGATLMNSQDNLSCYKYNCLTTSTAQNLRSWMMTKLEKKASSTFGPLKSKGVLLIDNVEMPQNENESLFRDCISQMLENNSWYHLLWENFVNLENMHYVLCMTIGLKDPPESNYDEELYSRTWSLFNPEPNEDILVRIFSSSMNATFRKIGFPPEISSVIPAIINSTIHVYTACKKALIIENEKHFLHIETVNLRDIFQVLHGVSLLPKENADNKKLFTRLWVHEILRVFYDRLLCNDAKKMIYESIRECVKNNFRENFESGFEHLGKINGLVTQQNLRNLMFGVYLSEDKKNRQYTEMTEIEQFEKKLQGEIKDFNSSKDCQNEPLHLFPLRTTLEMISRVCRQLNMPQGHMLIYGEGAEGRRISIRSAAILLGIKYIEIENYTSYDDISWRHTIRDTIERVGSQNEEIVLCLHFRQLKRHDFLAKDLDDFLTNGFIHDLFTTDEMHRINENVHKLMMENERNCEKSDSPPIDITPAILEKEFISNCEKKLHIMIIIDNDDTSIFEFLRSHRSIVSRSIVYRKEEWPEDTLKKAGDFVFEELSLSRDIKKALNKFCVFAYTEARKLSKEVKETNISIPSSVYLRLLRHVVYIHSEKSAELEQQKSRLQMGIEKFNQVEEQIKEFEIELESIGEKIQNVQKEEEEMKITKLGLDEFLESVKTIHKNVSNQLAVYIRQKEEKEHIYKDKLAGVEEKYAGLRNSMGNLKLSEIQALKNVKFNLPLVKLCLQCMNLYAVNDGEKGLETEPKKLLDFLKKILNDPKFVSNLIEVQLTDETLSIFHRDILTNPDWDASNGHKIAYFLGLFIKWSSTLYDLIRVRKEVKPYVEEVNRLSEYIEEQERLKDDACEKIQATSEKISDAEEKMKKIQSSHEELMSELDRCMEKKSLGNLIYENFKEVIEFWRSTSSNIKEDLATLLGDVAFYSMDITICSSFNLDQRDILRRSFEKKAEELELLYSKNYLQQLLEPNTIVCWSHFIHARDEFSLSKLCSLKSSLNWPYIFNLNDEGRQILLSVEKDKKIKYIRYGSTGYLKELENAVAGGFLTIMENVSSYDYRLKNILTKSLITTKNMCGKVEEQRINIGGKLVEYSQDFKLYLVSSTNSIIKEYQSKCQVLNFQLASNMLSSIFSDVILSQKNAKEKLKLDNVINQMMCTTKSLEGLTEELLSSLDIEKGILDVPGLGNRLMENKKEFTRLRSLYDNLEMLQQKLSNNTQDTNSLRLAKRCGVVFEVIRKLKYLDNYDITLKKFLSIIKVSLVNKEDEDRIPIPEVLNQLRPMFSDKTHYLIFVFWLHFYLNYDESTMNVLKSIKGLMNVKSSGFFDEAIATFCDFFSEEKTDLLRDIVKDSQFFVSVPEPWSSRLNPFQIFVLKTIEKPEQVIDLAKEFCDNYMDSIFLDVLEPDFGQFPLSVSNKAIVLSTNDEESEEEIRLIKKLSDRQQVISIFISFDVGIKSITEAMIKAQKLGKWIIITSYKSNNFEDLKKLITKNNFQVHNDFKLWILNYKRQIPKEIWRECLVINQSPPGTFHQRFTSLLVNGPADEDFINNPNSETDQENESIKMQNIFFRLALFHSCLVERIKYGPRGGWNVPYKFNQSHFRSVMGLFKTHFIRLTYEHNRAQCLRAILIDCFYMQYLSDERDRNLLSTMYQGLMNTKEINLKERSSLSGMIQVAKSLEDNQIISLLNISQNTQSFHESLKSKDFMKTLTLYPSNGDAVLSQEVIVNNLTLIRSVLEKQEDQTFRSFECIRKEEYILDYIWTIEIHDLKKCLSIIKDDIEYILRVVNRETQINEDYATLVNPLSVNMVPLSWVNYVNKDKHPCSFLTFSSTIARRIDYFKTGFKDNAIELNSLSNLRIFLNGLVLHIMSESNETNDLFGFFIDEIPSNSSGNVFYLKGVKLEGASWDTKRSALIPEKAGLESFRIISLRKGNIEKNERLYSCPFYLTQSRRLRLSSSSFHFNVQIPTLMSEEKHVEMSTAVMIEDFE